ncbi:MAG: hypothetical protein IKK84_04120 [Clostridia bacterium]|nr:hypothetical protein [Clostridia bacterium]MBR6641278.1 hypothetical protein [Clostridia bacterium]
MKNIEKFLLIFMITIITLSIGSVVAGYIEFNKVSKEQSKLWEEIENGKYLDKYSFEIEDGIKQHTNINEDDNGTDREKALKSYLSSRNTEYLLEYTNVNARMVEIINLLFYSLSITFFVYCMITLVYKDIKQYILDNIGILLVFIVLWVMHNALALGDSLLFRNNMFDVLPVLYVIFLIGNITKNIVKRKRIKQEK